MIVDGVDSLIVCVDTRALWLHPGNVAGAITQVRPSGVDVASGVEEEGNPRRKDPARLEEFFEAVRAADEGGR